MIIDTPDNCTPNLLHLTADQVTTVMRYLTANTDSFKLIKPAEAKALAAAGIRLGLVYEMGGGAPGQPPLSAMAGNRDAAFSVKWAPTVGAPKGSCIYFAADNDFVGSQINTEILPYFKAVSETFEGSGYEVGVYGSGLVCKTVVAAGYATKAWLSGSLGWTDSRAYLAQKPPELVLIQQRMDTKLANMDVDTDEALGDFGDFLPFADTMV